MARGVYIEVTHREGCGLKDATASARRVPIAGNGRRLCKCSPRARAQVKRQWVAEGVFAEGWTQANLRQFEAEAIAAREAHESGQRIIERDAPPTMGELAEAYLASLKRRRELDEVAAQRGARRSPRTTVRPERAPRSLEVEFVLAMLDEAAKRSDGLLLHDMILTGVTTGMRKREIAGLRPECIHLRERRIEVAGQLIGDTFEPPKSFVERTTVVCDVLAERLRLRLARGVGEYVFAVPGQELPWSRMEQGSRFNAVWEACGPRRKSDSWHALRHTFATTLDAGRCRPAAIDAVMGHSNQGVSFRYRHVLEPDLDDMVRVLNECFDRTPPDVVRLDDRRRKAA
jgi:integrase